MGSKSKGTITIEATVAFFNTLPQDESPRNNYIMVKTLRSLLERPSLAGIVVYGLAHYKPRSIFGGETDSKHWYLRVATNNKKKNHPSFIAIEERRDGNWHLKKLIPLKDILYVKTEPAPTNEEMFNLFMSVNNLLNMETPASIDF